MNSKRRNFLRSAGLLAGGLSIAPSFSSPANPTSRKILILGGTGFIGPNMVKYAVKRGHQVSIFSRGKRKSTVAGIEHLIGDRNNDLSALSGKKWDVVIDNNTYDYRWVKRSTEALKDSCDHYIFISSISAYQSETIDPSASGYEFKDRILDQAIIDRNSPTFVPPNNWNYGDKADYGLTKAISERLAEKAFPGRTTIVRPGVIVGPGDPTNRWSYWLHRAAGNEEFLAPGNPLHSVQFIDQRDVTEWVVRLAEQQKMGAFNACGPQQRMSWEQMLTGLKSVFKSKSIPTWVPETFLQGQSVKPWQDLPCWIPGDALTYVGITDSLNAGLSFRSLSTTATDHLEWERKHLQEKDKQSRSRQFGLSRSREKQLLEQWRGQV